MKNVANRSKLKEKQNVKKYTYNLHSNVLHPVQVIHYKNTPYSHGLSRYTDFNIKVTFIYLIFLFFKPDLLDNKYLSYYFLLNFYFISEPNVLFLTSNFVHD